MDNRRSFIKRIATIVAGTVVAPNIFAPKLIKPGWKGRRIFRHTTVWIGAPLGSWDIGRLNTGLILIRNLEYLKCELTGLGMYVSSYEDGRKEYEYAPAVIGEGFYLNRVITPNDPTQLTC